MGWSNKKVNFDAKLERVIILVDTIPKKFVSVIDGMALVRQSNDSAENILKFLATTTTYGDSRIDIVFDVYQSDAIKNAKIGSFNWERFS